MVYDGEESVVISLNWLVIIYLHANMTSTIKNKQNNPKVYLGILRIMKLIAFPTQKWNY